MLSKTSSSKKVCCEKEALLKKYAVKITPSKKVSCEKVALLKEYVVKKQMF